MQSPATHSLFRPLEIPVLGPNSGPSLSTGTIIGITVAIVGNVLISLALNLQKLAHKRLDAERPSSRFGNTPPTKDAPDSTPHRVQTANEQLQRSVQQAEALPDIVSDRLQSNGSLSASETQPLLPSSLPPSSSQYGLRSSSPQPQRRFFLSRLLPERWVAGKAEKVVAVPVEVAEVLPTDDDSATESGGVEDAENEAAYLQSKLWWLGFCLMNVGELGNFISYAWAPASVVAPLGTFALIANCVFAPLILKERFRKRDLIGIALAIIGAVTVVAASNASDTRLDPDALVKAIKQIPFIIYSGIYVAGAIILATLSEGQIGRQYVFIDVGLCALFGGFTVLSTKAISTLLTMEWMEMFTQIITYPVLAVLIATGIGQVRYLNRALMRFDGKIVIPVQFVLFNLSAIVGSAILYGDFKRATFHQVVTFLYGCGATFTGVFIIAWAPPSHDEDEEEEEEETPGPTTRSLSPVREQGTLGRRRRATLVIQPSGELPFHQGSLRHRQSAMSLIGLSPAQHLLLMHTPPREVPLRDLERDWDSHSPDTPRRRSRLPLFGDDFDEHPRGLASTRRDSSLNGRRRLASSPTVTDPRFRPPPQ